MSLVVRLGKLLLALASTVILGSESCGTMTIFYCLMTLGVVPLYGEFGSPFIDLAEKGGLWEVRV
jgi:hypothetical protein